MKINGEEVDESRGLEDIINSLISMPVAFPDLEADYAKKSKPVEKKHQERFNKAYGFFESEYKTSA